MAHLTEPFRQQAVFELYVNKRALNVVAGLMLGDAVLVMLNCLVRCSTVVVIGILADTFPSSHYRYIRTFRKGPCFLGRSPSLRCFCQMYIRNALISLAGLELQLRFRLSAGLTSGIGRGSAALGTVEAEDSTVSAIILRW